MSLPQSLLDTPGPGGPLPSLPSEFSPLRATPAPALQKPHAPALSMLLQSPDHLLDSSQKLPSAIADLFPCASAGRDRALPGQPIWLVAHSSAPSHQSQRHAKPANRHEQPLDVDSRVGTD